PLVEEFVRLDHGFLRLEHGVENRLRQLSLLGVTANSAKHAKLTHQAPISCIEVPVYASRGLLLLRLWFWRHQGLHEAPRRLPSAAQYFYGSLVPFRRSSEVPFS